MAAGNIVRSLGYWETICANNARWSLGAGNMVVLGTGTGPLDEATYQAALRILFNRHPLLQCRLDIGSDGLHFVHDVAFENIPLHMHHVESEDELIHVWEQMLHDELPDRHRLWEPLFAPSRDGSTWRVLLKIHHSIADGRSLGHILEQFVEIAASLLRGESPRQEIVAVPPASEHRLAETNTSAAMNAAFEAAGDEPEITPWPIDHEADLECRRVRIAFRSLDAESCSRIVATCHEHGVTLLSAFAAAAAITHARHVGGPVDTDSMVPVDLRRFFETTPPRDELHMGVTCIRVHLNGVHPADDLWQVATRFKAELTSAIVPEIMPPVDFTAADLKAATEGWTDVDGRYRHGWCLTNIGKLDWTGDHPPLTTERVEMTASAHFGGFPMLIPILTHKGILRVAFTWTEPLMDRTTANGWIDDIWKTFSSVADDCTTEHPMPRL
jgi:NRPS condensation-like uncharacterized protein